jgi:hypothetical protein
MNKIKNFTYYFPICFHLFLSLSSKIKQLFELYFILKNELTLMH